jgi:hypothetical protein
MSDPRNPPPESQRRANLRLALILLSTAVVFAAGFVAKIWLLGPN